MLQFYHRKNGIFARKPYFSARISPSAVVGKKMPAAFSFLESMDRSRGLAEKASLLGMTVRSVPNVSRRYFTVS